MHQCAINGVLCTAIVLVCDLKQLSEDKSKNFFDSEEGASGQNRLNRLSFPWRVLQP